MYTTQTTVVVNWLLINSLLVAGALISFWLWALTDCLIKEEPSFDKVCWIIVLVGLNVVGSLLFIWHRKLNRVTAKAAGLLPPGI